VWMNKIRQGPTGLLLYRPAGSDPNMTKELPVELTTNILAALLASFLLWQVGGSLPSYGARAGFVALLGLLPGLEVDLSYWNWYGYPGSYTAAQIVMAASGWLLAGLVMARIVRRPGA
ncbi:MAG: hypothetical protein ACRD44_16700, partial [Bryobacteraceae bacterium]